MSWRYHGHARVNTRSPEAFAVCDRCYRLFNRSSLQWQYAWRGPRLVNLQKLVCPRCLDIPNEQQRPRILSADPVPVPNPRPENYITDNNTFLTIEGATFYITDESGNPLVIGIATN